MHTTLKLSSQTDVAKFYPPSTQCQFQVLYRKTPASLPPFNKFHIISARAFPMYEISMKYIQKNYSVWLRWIFENMVGMCWILFYLAVSLFKRMAVTCFTRFLEFLTKNFSNSFCITSGVHVCYVWFGERAHVFQALRVPIKYDDCFLYEIPYKIFVSIWGSLHDVYRIIWIR